MRVLNQLIGTTWIYKVMPGQLPSGKRLHNYGKIHHAING